MKQAVILAAGRGRRLREGIPKCLLKLDARTLIEHQIHILRSLGVTDICVVIGYGADQVRAVLRDSVTYIHNEHALTTNSLYSLWLTRQWVRGAFVQLNADVIADAAIYQRLLSARGTALAYDSGSGTTEEHMKIAMRGPHVASISKTLDTSLSRGESLGLLKFDDVGAAMLLEAADDLIDAGMLNQWAPAAVDRIAADHQIRAVDVAGLAWTEIDFIEDALYAKYEILPAVRQGWLNACRPTPRDRIRKFAHHVTATVSSVGGVIHDLF